MSKEKALLSRFGTNLAESMGAGRAAAPPAWAPQTTAPPPPAAATRADGTTRLRTAVEIQVGRIAADPDQPRAEFDDDALQRLADSLKTHGQIQPIAVRWSEPLGRYLIVAGERRWRASVLAGRPAVSAVILEGEHTESQVLELQLIENALREDLRPVEQAKAYRRLMDRNGWPATRLAEVLHLNCGTVTRALALLDLPDAVRDQVEAGGLAPSVAYEISKVATPDDQSELAARVVAEGLSRAETIAAVREAAARRPRAAGKKGRGASQATPRPRVFKTAAARVTIEPRKNAGPEALLAAAREVVLLLESEAGAPPEGPPG